MDRIHPTGLNGLSYITLALINNNWFAFYSTSISKLIVMSYTSSPFVFILLGPAGGGGGGGDGGGGGGGGDEQ